MHTGAAGGQIGQGQAVAWSEDGRVVPLDDGRRCSNCAFWDPITILYINGTCEHPQREELVELGPRIKSHRDGRRCAGWEAL